jgi:hypothetical protein
VESRVARPAHDKSPAKCECEEQGENASVADDAIARNCGGRDWSGPGALVKFDGGAGVFVFVVVAQVGDLWLRSGPAPTCDIARLSRAPQSRRRAANVEPCEW